MWNGVIFIIKNFFRDYVKVIQLLYSQDLHIGPTETT